MLRQYFSRIRPLGFSLAIAGTSLFCHGCSSQVETDVLAVVLAVKGEAVCGSTPLAPGMKLSSGEVLEVRRGGSLQLLLVPGLLADLREEAVVRLETLRLAKDGNAMTKAIKKRTAVLVLERGSLFGVVLGSEVKDSRLVVKGPGETWEAFPGTLFHVAMEGPRTRVTCARGKVGSLGPAFAGSELGPGFYVDVPGEQWEPRVAANEDARQETVAEAVATERDLLNRENELRYASLFP